jgi:AsmA protein
MVAGFSLRLGSLPQPKGRDYPSFKFRLVRIREVNMKKALKRGLFWGGGIILFILALLIIIPFFIDLNDYKPEIEKIASDAVNRPFKINGNIKLKLFPVAEVALSDLHLGNPSGYQEKDFVSIKAFDLRIKLLPLLKKEIQIKRFEVVEPQITLVKSKNGQANWEGIGKAAPETKAAPPEPAKAPPKKGQPTSLPIKTFTVEEFSVKNAALFWIDHQQGTRKEIKELNMSCKEISLERPIRMTLSALVDKKPISVQGSIGPLGKEPGKGAVPLDVVIKLFNELDLKIKGQIIGLMDQPQFDIALETSHFSIKKLFGAMGMDMPFKTSRPEALTDLAFSAKIKGSSKGMTLSDSLFQLDQSKFRFNASFSEFEKPRIDFDGKLDQINVDHYLPPPEKKPAGSGPAPESAAKKGKTDYAPLRKMVLNAKMQIGQLIVQKVTLTDISMKTTGKNGIFNIDPFSFKLYQGAIESRTTLDVSRESPQTQAVMRVKGVQVGPLIRDMLDKDILEGKMEADMNLKMDGDNLTAIRRSLNGNGDMLFKDGAIVGVDLTAMVQNIQSAFSGQAAATEKKTRTDFTEFKMPFTITNGLFETKNASMNSPFFRIQAFGKANLVNESLDFRIESKIVTTVAGQGDQAKRKGLTVPVNVTGTFSDPKFSPDLGGMLKKGVEKIISDQLQGGDKKKKLSVEDLLKSFLDE